MLRHGATPTTRERIWATWTAREPQEAGGTAAAIWPPSNPARPRHPGQGAAGPPCRGNRHAWRGPGGRDARESCAGRPGARMWTIQRHVARAQRLVVERASRSAQWQAERAERQAQARAGRAMPSPAPQHPHRDHWEVFTDARSPLYPAELGPEPRPEGSSTPTLSATSTRRRHRSWAARSASSPDPPGRAADRAERAAPRLKQSGAAGRDPAPGEAGAGRCASGQPAATSRVTSSRPDRPISSIGAAGARASPGRGGGGPTTRGGCKTCCACSARKPTPSGPS